MTLVPYNRRGLSLFDELSRELSRGFANPFYRGVEGAELPAVTGGDWAPAVDVREEEDRYVVSADIPGVDPKEIDITFDSGVLAITGERKTEHTEEKEGFKRVERSFGSFRRQFSLPESINPDEIKASGKNGVLVIDIPKSEQTKPRRISVQ